MHNFLSIAKKYPFTLAYGGFICTLLILSTPFFASATVLYSQTTKDTSFSVGSVSSRYQYLGTGLNGTVGTITVNLSSTGAPSPLSVSMQLICHNSEAHALASPATAECTSSGAGESPENGTPQVVNGGGQTEITLALSTPFPLNPAKYYLLYVNSSTSNKLMWGTASNLYPAGHCFSSTGTCGTVLDIYFILDDGNSDFTTGIRTVTPAGGSTIATSTAATFGATGYVNADDYETGMFVQIQYALYSNSQTSVANPSALFTTLTFPLTSSGLFNVSTTSPATRGGQYTMQTQIRKASLLNNVINFFGFSQFANLGITTATSTKFVANQLNGFDVFTASTTASVTAYLASSTLSLAACSSWTSFSLGDCLNLMFVPQLAPISEALADFKNGFLSYVPWGYVTRFAVILSGTATTTLPAIAITVPLGNPDIPAQYTNGTFTLDVNDMLQGGSDLIGDVHTTFGDDVTFREATEPFVKLSIALALFMGIVHDLLGMRHGTSRRKGQLS